jgi:Ca2+/Na+ antiporter
MEHNDNLGKKYFENNRYPALRMVAGIYIAYAVIIGLVFIIMTFKYLIEEEWMTALSIFIGGSILILVFIAFSESIKVFLDIEYNTRRALMYVTLGKEKLEKKRVEKSQGDSVSKEELEKELSLFVKDPEQVEKLNS